jgi:acyl-CoA reductase-like NAD-dependent aldehyde dehydrogenase
VSREEIFGPVLAVQPITDLDEGIRLANDTSYGLQAGIFTGDLDSALRAGSELFFGGVTVNESPTFRADQQPYGGVRDSGNTREGPAWAIHDYLEETVVIVEQG